MKKSILSLIKALVLPPTKRLLAIDYLLAYDF